MGLSKAQGAAFTLAELRKGLYPWPVYCAELSDGSQARMSIWTKAKRADDAEAILHGRRVIQSLTRVREGRLQIVAGRIEWKGETVAHDDMKAPTKAVKRRPPAKVVGQALAELLAYLDGANDDDGAIMRAREIAKLAV